MSPTAIARRGDAPYLTHAVSHHGQLTLIPPQNAGRIRKTNSPIRSTSALNLCDSASSIPSPRRPRSPRAQSTTIRRAIDPQQDLTVPDFPPPSFQEALSTPVYGIPAMVSPSEISLMTYHSVAARPSSAISYPTTSASSTERSVSIYQDAFDDDVVADGDLSHSDSDSSGVEMVSLDASQTEWDEDRRQGLTLSDRVRREKERLQMAEATWLHSPSVMSRQPTCSHCGASRIVDEGDELSIVAIPASSPTTENHEEAYQPVPGPTTKKRFLFRPKHSQSMSSASVPSTPVSNRGQPSFQTLAQSDQRKRRSRSMSLSPRPLSPSSVVSSRTSLGFMSRRLFSHNSKGKDRSTSEEPLEAWEVLDAAPGSVDLPEQLPVSRLRRTLSKMNLATIGPMSSSVDSPKAIKPYPIQPIATPQILRDKQSPKKDLPPIQNRPVPPIPPSLQTHPIRPPPPVPPLLHTHSPLATNVYSRSPPPLSPLIMTPSSPEAEPSNKRRLPPPLPSRKNPSTAATSVVERGRRQRCQSMSVHSTSPKMSFPPLSPIHNSVMSNLDGFCGHPFNASIFPSSPYASRSNSPSSSSELSYVTDNKGTQLTSPSSSPSTIRLQDRGTQGGESIQQFPTPSITPTALTPSGHHYSDRPLPTPPYDSPINAAPITAASFVYGDEKAAVRLNSSGDEAQNALPSVMFPRTGMPMGVDPSHSQEPTPVSSQINSASPPLQHSVSRSSFSVIENSGLWQIRNVEDDDDDEDDDYDDYEERTTLSSEITELDILMSRIEDSSPGQGGSYEDLLLVSEVLGQGVPPPADALQLHQGQSRISTEKADITPFVGRIETRRRRTTKDGCVKLKLSLLGVKVDNCSICLSQFKDQGWAALGPSCQHSYHERCLRKWLMRNRACPLCRVPLDLEGNGV